MIADLDPERRLLGSMLLDPDRIAPACEIVHASDFEDACNVSIFLAIVAVHGRAEPVDFMTVGEELRSFAPPAHCDPGYLVELGQTVTSSTHAPDLARRVAARSDRRTGTRHLREALTELESGDCLNGHVYEAFERVKRDLPAARGAKAELTLPVCKVFELERIDPATDIVRGLVGPREKVMWHGDKSSCKTTGTVALFCSIVTGEPFFGLEVQHSGPVVYLAADGPANGISNRAEAWCVGREPRLREAIARDFHVIHATPNLLLPAQQDAFVRTIKAVTSAPAVVAIDTLAAVTPGAEENSQQFGTAFISLCNMIADKTGAAVIFLHHTGKNGDGYRGSSSLGAGVEVIIASANKGRGRFELRVTKQRDREVPEHGWAFEKEQVALGKSDGITGVRICGVMRADEETVCEGLETTLARVADYLVATGHAGGDSMRLSLETGIAILLDSGPKRFGEIVAACKALMPEQATEKARSSKVGRVLAQMTKDKHLAESGAKRGRAYTLDDKGRSAYSGVLDAFRKLSKMGDDRAEAGRDAS